MISKYMDKFSMLTSNAQIRLRTDGFILGMYILRIENNKGNWYTLRGRIVFASILKMGLL